MSTPKLILDYVYEHQARNPIVSGLPSPSAQGG